MARRSEALIPLSHDHHQALYVAKVMKDAESAESASEAFGEFWTKHGEVHFRVEEEVLLPGSDLPGPSSDEDVARMLDDHLEIRRRAAIVLAGKASLEQLQDLAVLMTDHVRFEERQLFPRIESRLGPEQLEVLAKRIRLAELSGED